MSPGKLTLLLALTAPSWLRAQVAIDCPRHGGRAAAVERVIGPEELLGDYRRAALARLADGPRAVLDSQSLFGVRYFPYDPTLAFTAVFRPAADTVLVNFPTSDGEVRAYAAYGTLIFFREGAAHALEVFEVPGMRAHPIYGDLLFLPFFDASNGASTYGGGRYLDLSRAAFETGDYRVDFNRAYNPYCAYAAGYSCPVPPLSNALPFPVHAGEAAFVTPDAAPDPVAGGL